MKSWLEKKTERLSGTPEYETERLLLEITEALADRLETSGVKRSELARRMGVDRAVVTRLLSGDQNMTVKTLVSTSLALGCNVQVRVEPIGSDIGTAAGVASTGRTEKRTTRIEQVSTASSQEWEPVAIRKQIDELKAKMKTYQIRGGKELNVDDATTAA